MNAKLTDVVSRLERGETVLEYKESGNSMVPLIHHQEPVTLSPVDREKLEKGDMVLVKVRGRWYIHKVLSVRGDQVQIGNNRGGVNGWTPRMHVYGIVTAVNGRPVGGTSVKIRRSLATTTR